MPLTLGAYVQEKERKTTSHGVTTDGPARGMRAITAIRKAYLQVDIAFRML